MLTAILANLKLPSAAHIFLGLESDAPYNVLATEDIVANKFGDLGIDKAVETDDMLPMLLKELRVVICHLLTIVLKTSLDSGVVPEDCKWQTYVLFTKRKEESL